MVTREITPGRARALNRFFVLTLMALPLALVSACAAKKTSTANETPSVPPQPGATATVAHPSMQGDLDPQTWKKVLHVFDAIFRNNDKKAKLGYGRYHRSFSPSLQLALDLRFHNIEHAKELIDQLRVPAPEAKFWKTVLEKKSAKLSDDICAVIQLQTALRFEGDPNDKQVSDKLQSALHDLAKANQSPSELDQSLAPIDCNEAGDICQPLSEDLQKVLLQEPFMDRLHNMERRDVHYLTAHDRHWLDMATYSRYVKPLNILRLYRAVDALDEKTFPRKMHFLRRLKGIVRDLKLESLTARAQADQVLKEEDKADLLKALLSFARAYPLLDWTIGVSHDLASCGLPVGH